MAGDVVRVNDSPLSATVSVLNEITGPAVGIYSVYSLFNDCQMMTTASAEQQLEITPASDDEIDLRQVAGCPRPPLALDRGWWCPRPSSSRHLPAH